MKMRMKNLRSKYQYIGFLPGSVRIKEKGFWGINDYDGNEILPSNYIELFTLSSGYGLIAARDSGFWDIYDYHGNRINVKRFDFIYPYYGFFGMSKVKIGNNWGIINRYGNIIVPVKYKKIEKFGKGICLHNESELKFIDRNEIIKLTGIKNTLHSGQEKKSIEKKSYKIHSKKSSLI